MRRPVPPEGSQAELAVVLTHAAEVVGYTLCNYALTAELAISRDGAAVWSGSAGTSSPRRRIGELAG